MKNGVIDYDATMKQLEQMPEERKASLKVGFANCKDKGNIL